jgi:hypothetical protein
VPLAVAGLFLFFVFFGLVMILCQLVFEAYTIGYYVAKRNELRRLRYNGGFFVELPPVTEKEFEHLPDLKPSPCFHLFLSREGSSTVEPTLFPHVHPRTNAADNCAFALRPDAWPISQAVCKIIKQQFREVCPSMQVFLDVDE